MIAVLIDTMEDTHFLSKVYEGVDNVRILINPSSEELERALLEDPSETLLAMGHGTSCGLLASNWSGFVLDPEMAKRVNLKDRNVIGIWCYADRFAQSNGLKGFFTSMFVSNQMEANMYGFSTMETDVFHEVELFTQRVNTLIKNNVPLSEWTDALRSQADMTKDYVAFNYDGLKYFE